MYMTAISFIFNHSKALSKSVVADHALNFPYESDGDQSASSSDSPNVSIKRA